MAWVGKDRIARYGLGWKGQDSQVVGKDRNTCVT